MPKNRNLAKPDFVTRGELIDSLKSQKSFLSKRFINMDDGKRLDGRIDSIISEVVFESPIKDKELLNGDGLLYFLIFLLAIVTVGFAYVASAIQKLNKRATKRPEDSGYRIQKQKESDIDWYATNNTQRRSEQSWEQFEKKITQLEQEINSIKTKVEHDRTPLIEAPAREALSENHQPIQTTVYYFEPTVVRRSGNGLSVFTVNEQVSMYEVFQLDVNPDGNTGFFYFNESLERGKNDVATELRKLFPFAEHEGSGSRTNFKTTKKGIARLVSGNQWEVVEKAKILIS